MYVAFFNAKNLQQVIALTGAVFISLLALLGAKASAAAPNSVAITEFMANPAVVTDANGEWVEIKNTSSSAINLTGWDIDGSTITGNVVLGAGKHAVICKNANVAQNDGVVCDATSGFSLNNTTDTINVRDENNTVIASLSYDSTHVQEGHSTQANGMVIETIKKYSTNNFGTPAHNAVTPPDATGEIRVHHVIDANRDTWPGFAGKEAHFKGRTVRLYNLDNNWEYQNEVVTTGKVYDASAKFVVALGNYALCEVEAPGYEQTFARTIRGWFDFPAFNVNNASGVDDEYTQCETVTVTPNGLTSHVFGDALLQDQDE